MAGYALAEGLQKHQKVYSFLKRSLPQERYEGVRVIEPCVVVSEDFNKAFKFAVLGDELLYITENPPKLSKDIKLTVDLADIISVELIHDFAEFLSGDLRSKNQHILIVYKRNGTAGQSSNHSISSPANEISSPSKLALSASFLIASPVLQLETLEREGQKSPILQPRSPSLSKTKDQLLSPRNEAFKFQSFSNPNVREIIHKSGDFHTFSLSSTNVNMDVCSPQGSRPLPPTPPGHESEVTQVHSRFRTRTDSKGKPLTPTSSRHLRRKSEKETDLNSSSSSSELDLPPHRPSSKSLHDFNYSNDSLNSKYHLSSSVDFAMPRSPRIRMGSNEYGKSVSGSLDSDDEKAVGVEGLETTKIHLYVLTENSPMFVHLKSTWNNCILKSTLKCGQEGTPTSSPTRSQSKVDNSQLMQLFHQLKSEILHSHRMEKTFVLVQELLTAAQKSFLLKKYFWKSPELFPFLVNQVLVYLPQSHSKSSGNNRADELELTGTYLLQQMCLSTSFVVVLLETLVCMFRGTESLSSRLSVAKSSKGQTVRELLQVITKTPSVGRKVQPANISPAAHQLLCGPHQLPQSANGKDEMTTLLSEITNHSSALLYEIILLVQQAKCFAVEDNVLNICWLMKSLESQDTTITFVQRMMEQTQRPFSSRGTFLSPREAVLFYKQLSILRNFLEYSESISSHIRAVYSEEFRYYIRRDVVRKKVPVNYPLASPILKVLEEVTKLVLDQKTKSHCR